MLFSKQNKEIEDQNGYVMCMKGLTSIPFSINQIEEYKLRSSYKLCLACLLFFIRIERRSTDEMFDHHIKR